NPTIFFIAWVAGGLIALCGALTYAEIGSRFPVTGGYYKIFAECYHPSVAFAINCVILISNAASMSGVALIGSEYISQVFLIKLLIIRHVPWWLWFLSSFFILLTCLDCA